MCRIQRVLIHVYHLWYATCSTPGDQRDKMANANSFSERSSVLDHLSAASIDCTHLNCSVLLSLAQRALTPPPATMPPRHLIFLSNPTKPYRLVGIVAQAIERDVSPSRPIAVSKRELLGLNQLESESERVVAWICGGGNVVVIGQNSAGVFSCLLTYILCSIWSSAQTVNCSKRDKETHMIYIW